MGILPDWHVASLAAAALVDGVTDAVLLLKRQAHKIQFEQMLFFL